MCRSRRITYSRNADASGTTDAKKLRAFGCASIGIEEDR